MKDIKDFILEASNTEHMFLGLTSRRTDDDFTFNVGDECILIKYDTHHYAAQIREMVKIVKVLKNNIVVEYLDEKYADSNDFLKTLKFDKKGIYVQKNKNKYLGKSTLYWVLYNKELVDDKDLQELSSDKACSWGFKIFDGRFHDDELKCLKKYIKELKK